MVVDPCSDNGFVRLCRLSRIVDFPDFVKQADIDEQVNTEGIPASSFADILKRKFPVHTKAAAYLSYLYYLDQADEMSSIEARRTELGLKKAAGMWSIRGEFELAKRAVAAAREPKAVKRAYALVADGVEYLPIDTTSAIMASAREFDENRAGIPYDLRKHAAKQMLKAAYAKGIDHGMPNSIHTAAGCGLTTKAAAEREVLWRVKKEKNAKMRESLAAAQMLVSNQPEGILSKDVAEKLAKDIATYDETTGLRTRYDKDVPFPEDVLFAFTKSAADDVMDGLTVIGDEVYNTADVSTARLDEVFRNKTAGVLDVDYAKLTKLAASDESACKAIKAVLREKGAKPVSVRQVELVHTAANKAAGQFSLNVSFSRNAVKAADTQDPILKRAEAIFARLKAGRDEQAAADEKREATQTGLADMIAAPRDTKRKFINKAPQKSETVTV